MSKEQDCKETAVEFGTRGSAIPGSVAGAAIAVGVPAVTLIWGHNLSPGQEMAVIFVGIGVGGLIALTTAFFHAVMPSRVGGCGGGRSRAMSRDQISATSPD
jgi:hypothetical protein